MDTLKRYSTRDERLVRLSDLAIFTLPAIKFLASSGYAKFRFIPVGANLAAPEKRGKAAQFDGKQTGSGCLFSI
jgi:hypothetical protein